MSLSLDVAVAANMRLKALGSRSLWLKGRAYSNLNKIQQFPLQASQFQNFLVTHPRNIPLSDSAQSRPDRNHMKTTRRQRPLTDGELIAGTARFYGRLRPRLPGLSESRIGARAIPLFPLLLAGLSVAFASAAQTPPDGTVRDHLWIWAHPEGAYNDNYIASLPRRSRIEPVAAAQWMGFRNLIFIRYNGKPAAPFDDYYAPFRKLHRVYWTVTGNLGATSAEDRDQTYRLAEANGNICGFIMDDFFHEATVPGSRNADSGGPWRAEDSARFPVTLTFTPPSPVACGLIEIFQSAWSFGEYRTREMEVEIETDRQFARIAQATLPNEPGASIRLAVPDRPFTAIRVKILSSYEAPAWVHAPLSCGLSSVQCYRGNQRLDMTAWKAEASSSHPGYEAAALIGPLRPFEGSLTPAQIHGLRQRSVRGKKLPIMVVVYTSNISPRAKWHLDEADEISLWTWRPQDLNALEANLTALERLVPRKPIYLGCYMFDFDQVRPLSVEIMRYQTELGYRWLRQRRIQGIIFVSTSIVDVGLDAVDWTRKWIAAVGDERL